MMKWIVSLLMVFSAIALAATSAKDAYLMLKNNQAIFIDVREADEVKDGMIEKATWMALSKLKVDNSWEKELRESSKGKKIFLYCRSGRRSEIARELLKQQGIEAENIGGYETLKTELPTTKGK
jgi:phage shock protein E